MSAMPSPYLLRREFDRYADLLRQVKESRASNAQHYAAGIAEGKRLSRAWLARNTGALIAFGVCVGVTLAVVLLPAMSWWLS